MGRKPLQKLGALIADVTDALKLAAASRQLDGNKGVARLRVTLHCSPA